MKNPISAMGVFFRKSVSTWIIISILWTSMGIYVPTKTFAATDIDIKTTKTVDKTSVVVWETLTYTLIHENIGNVDGSGTTIKDALPPTVDVTSISCLATGDAVCPSASPTADQLSAGEVVSVFPAGGKLTYTIIATANGNTTQRYIDWTSVTPATASGNSAIGTLSGNTISLSWNKLTPSCVTVPTGITGIDLNTIPQIGGSSGYSSSLFTPAPTSTTEWLGVELNQANCPADNGNQNKVTITFAEPIKDPTIHILNQDAGQLVFDPPFAATKVSGNVYFEVSPDGRTFNSTPSVATITGCGTGSNGTIAGCGSARASGYYSSISFFLNDSVPNAGSGDGFYMTISSAPVVPIENCSEVIVASGSTDLDPTNNSSCVVTTIVLPSPTAIDDTYTATGSTPVTLTPLTGDSTGTTIKSINGTDLTPGTAQIITVPNGTVNVSATGVITFTANPGYSGAVTFPYVIEDANGQTTTANQNITVNPALVVTPPVSSGGGSSGGSSSSSQIQLPPQAATTPAPPPKWKKLVAPLPPKIIDAKDNTITKVDPKNEVINILDNDTLNNKKIIKGSVKIVILDNAGINDIKIDKNGKLTLPGRIPPGLHKIKYRIVSTLDPDIFDDAEITFRWIFATFTLPERLPDTGTSLKDKWVRVIKQNLVETDTVARFTPSVTAKESSRDPYFYINSLPEKDRNALTYVVIPTSGIITPITEADPGSIDHKTIVSGKRININPYLKAGAMHYPNSAFGWEIGNMIISGHSSYWKKDDGRYKTVFGLLPTTDIWEEVWVMQRVRDQETNKIKYKIFRYQVKSSYNTNPYNVNILTQDQNKKEITLITCTPIGGLTGRWIVKGELIEE